MALPNFLVIGAARAGTTSLYHYLRQHPDVYMSPVKEPRYSRYEGVSDEAVEQVHGREAYERLFAGATSQRAIGEASPQYLNSPTGPDRIAEDLSGVRLIVSLRNPADRAYSSYVGRLRGATERCGVDEAMRPGTYYFDTSLYYPRLARYFARFERSRIRVILFDDLVADTRAVVRDLYAFLGVDRTFDGDVSKKHHAGSVPRSITMNRILLRTSLAARRLVPVEAHTGLINRAQRLLLRPPDPLPPSIRGRLLERFRDDIVATGALIGRDLTPWIR